MIWRKSADPTHLQCAAVWEESVAALGTDWLAVLQPGGFRGGTSVNVAFQLGGLVD